MIELIASRSISSNGKMDNFISGLMLENLRLSGLWDDTPDLKASSFSTGLVKRILEPMDVLRLILD